MCVVICLWSQKTRKVRLNTPIYAPNFLVVCIDLLIPSRAVRGSGMLFIGLFSICEGRRFQIGMKKVAVLHFLTIPNTANIWDSSLFSFNHRLSVCRFDSNFRCQFKRFRLTQMMVQGIRFALLRGRKSYLDVPHRKPRGSIRLGQSYRHALMTGL